MTELADRLERTAEVLRRGWRPTAADANAAVELYAAVFLLHTDPPAAAACSAARAARVDVESGPLADLAAVLTDLPPPEAPAPRGSLEAAVDLLAGIAATRTPQAALSSPADVEAAAAVYPDLWDLGRRRGDAGTVVSLLRTLAAGPLTPSLRAMLTTSAESIEAVHTRPQSSAARPPATVIAVLARVVTTRLDDILIHRPLITPPDRRSTGALPADATQALRSHLRAVEHALMTETWTPAPADRRAATQLIHAQQTDPSTWVAYRGDDPDLAHAGWRCLLSAVLGDHGDLLADADPRIADIPILSYAAIHATRTAPTQHKQEAVQAVLASHVLAAIATGDLTY